MKSNHNDQKFSNIGNAEEKPKDKEEDHIDSLPLPVRILPFGLSSYSPPLSAREMPFGLSSNSPPLSAREMPFKITEQATPSESSSSIEVIEKFKNSPFYQHELEIENKY